LNRIINTNFTILNLCAHFEINNAIMNPTATVMSPINNAAHYYESYY
jgi:hypothetical protein